MWDSWLSPSSSYSTAAVPPSADTEWERITCTLEMTPIVNFLSTEAAEIAARRPASPDPIISTSCAIVLISDNYVDPSILTFRKAANSHIYLELLQLIAT